MSKFHYCVSRYDDYGPFYEIDTKVYNNEKLVLKKSPHNGGSDKNKHWFETILQNPMHLYHSFRSTTTMAYRARVNMMSTELIAYLEKCDASDVLSGKDKNAYLTECIFRNDGRLILVVNDLVSIVINKPDGYRSVNFIIIRYANNQAIEFFAAELGRDSVHIKELRDRNESNVKRWLISDLNDPHIAITEYT